jgi:hypothetical protein
VSRLQPLFHPIYQYTVGILLYDGQNVLNACEGKVDVQAL